VDVKFYRRDLANFPFLSRRFNSMRKYADESINIASFQRVELERGSEPSHIWWRAASNLEMRLAFLSSTAHLVGS
jgi:hypothetical protein